MKKGPNIQNIPIRTPEVKAIRDSFLEQRTKAEKTMAEYRRRLLAAGFVEMSWDSFEAGPGVDPKLAESIWQEVTKIP